MSTPQKAVRDDSPRSLATGGSGHYASPSTAATHYSPVEQRNVTDSLYQSLVGKMGDMGISSKPSTSMGGEDPFVTDARRTGLSATAADYQPGVRTSISELTHASVPEYQSTSMRSAEKSFPMGYAQYASASFPASLTSASPTRVRHAAQSRQDMPLNRKFSTDVRPDGDTSWTRYIALTGIQPDEADDRNPNSLLSHFRESGCMMGVRNIKKYTDGLTLIFCYDHISEAKGAYESGCDALRCPDYPAGWKLMFLEEADIKDKQRAHEAQILVTVAPGRNSGYGPCYTPSNRSELVSAVSNELKLTGEIFAYDTMPSTPLAIRVEMCAISAADALVRQSRSSPMKIREQFMHIEFFSDDAIDHDSAVAIAARRFGQQDMMPHTPGKSFTLSSPSRPNTQSTVVVPEKIRTGDDVRTTVMIRNIPNKVDAAQFKTILDSHVFGKYDFSYLRIDFQNLCNVGYAFVNFTQAEDIIPLYEAIVGRHWNIYNSDKIAEMCYATIQGLDCCIEKFRNSSVMLEWQPHRPKLWFTQADGELAGVEKDFPPPTNYQKLQRSKDNAAEVGLYPPRGVSAYRHDSRQHLSMLDRGHPRTVLPDYHLTGISRGLLTYPHLMNGQMSQALSPVTPPYTGHTFGQPIPMSPYFLHGHHQLYSPSIMQHTPTTAMLHGGAVGLSQPDPSVVAMLAAQYSNQQRN